MFKRILVRLVNRAVLQHKITVEQRDEILKEADARDFQGFMQWLLDNYPAVIDMFLAFVQIFTMFA